MSFSWSKCWWRMFFSTFGSVLGRPGKAVLRRNESPLWGRPGRPSYVGRPTSVRTPHVIRSTSCRPAIKQHAIARSVDAFKVLSSALVVATRTTRDHSASASGHVYALICDAVAAQANGTPAMPEGVLLAAPDQGQIVASPGRMLSLAATILDDNEASAAGRIQKTA